VFAYELCLQLNFVDDLSLRFLGAVVDGLANEPLVSDLGFYKLDL
jgi:hypothetical protein